MEYTIVVVASASDPAPLQYIAPYAGCAMAEYFMYEEGKADALRLRRPLQAGRRVPPALAGSPPSAGPRGVSRATSSISTPACSSAPRRSPRTRRSSKLDPRIKKPGGSLTALPIIETQAGDVSAYIPTNVISITDGQIFLDDRPVLLRRPPRGGRRHLREPRRRQRADQGDEAGGRPAPARPGAVPRARGLRPVRLRPRRRHPAAARARRPHGRGAQAAAVPADAGRAAGGDHLRGDQRLPRRRRREADPAVGARLPRVHRGVSTRRSSTDIRTKKALGRRPDRPAQGRDRRRSSRCSSAE